MSLTLHEAQQHVFTFTTQLQIVLREPRQHETKPSHFYSGEQRTTQDNTSRFALTIKSRTGPKTTQDQIIAH